MSSRYDIFTPQTVREAQENLRILQRQLEKFKAFDLKGFCHPKQYDFVTDPNPYATAVTSRRAGKTVACAADLLNTAKEIENATCLYITLSRVNAKILLWPILKRINDDYNLGGTPNESELSLRMPGGGIIYLSGIKDISEIDKFRGMALKKVYLDEAQSMRPYIKDLIDDVLDPACIDHNGMIRVIGTPGPVPVGYFHEVATSNNWRHHFFTIWDNPFIANPQERLDAVLKRRGITVDDPSIQREWFGKWTLDLNSLVVRYDPSINHYDTLPTDIAWEHIIVADFGYEDADAIAVIAFNTKHPNAYLVEEKITIKQGITPLAHQLQELIAKYNPMKVLGDFGALGKKIAVELQTRFSIPIEAADKARKIEFIELMNDSLRTGKLKAKKDSRFAEDAMLLEWDMSDPTKPKISDRYHSDIVDCMIYGHRELLHWLYEKPKPDILPGTPQDLSRQEKQIWDEVRRKHNQQKEEESFWQDTWDYDI